MRWILLITVLSVCILAKSENTEIDLSKQGKEDSYELSFVNNPAVVNGVSKKAVKVFGKRPANMIKITFASGLPNVNQGAISFWISPKEWNGRDGKFHILGNFDFYDKEKKARSILIYKYGNPNINSKGLGLLAAYTVNSNKKKRFFLNMPQNKIGEDWKATNWHLLALCWNKTGKKPIIEFYVDGERVAFSRKEFDLSGKCIITLGPIWGEPDATLIDQFKIYDHVLSSEELDKELETAFEKIEKQKDKK